MKNFYLIFTFFFVSLVSFGQATDLFISEYAEGSSNNKYIEIYNGTGAPVDLGGYSLSSCSNGCDITGEFDYPDNVTFAPGTILNDGEVYVVAHPSSDPFILAEADQTFTYLSNGDDAFALTLAGATANSYTIIDIIGDLGPDVGTAWTVAGITNGTQNHTLVRKETICSGNPIELGSFGTDPASSEWEVLASNDWTFLASHTANCASSTDPQITTTTNGINGFIQYVGTPSPEQFFGVEGSNLVGDILATVSGDFEISLTSGSGFSNSLTLPQNAGEVALTQVFVRLNGSIAGSVQEEILLSDGADTAIVLLGGDILAPNPTILSSTDSLIGFSHFVGTPSAEQMFEVSGNFLTEDLNLTVSGEFEISAESNGVFGNSLVIPSNYNATVFDANATWLGYMNVFELPENGGGFAFGSGWGLADLQSIITPATNSVKLLPNVNTYADNPTDPFWVNQTTLEGNKTMEANTFVEPGASANDNDLTFAGNVVSNTLDSAYSATYFIKALDPNNGYADAFGGSKTFDLPASGEFSVSATAAELPAGLIVQYGFTVTGPNADPALVGTLGSVVVNGDFETGAVQSTPVYVRLNGAAQNLNQTGVIDFASSGAQSPQVLLLGETLDYMVSTIGAVTSNDNEGIAESLGDFVQLQGVVHCIDFDGNDGYSFTIIDENNDGINVFSFSDVSGYVVNEGDEIIVTGQIEQYNGLTEVVPDSIIVIAADMPTVSPTIVTALDESTESQWITIENLDFVTPIATFPTGSNNIDVTDGTNVYTIRIDSDTDIPGTNTPQAPFSVTGVGGQFDNSNPYDSGYQLFPCGTGSFETSPTTGLNEGISNSIIAYPNPFNESISISILNAMDYAISVFDCNGRIVYSSNISSSAQISTSSWNRGVYIVEMKNEFGDSKIQRLIK